MLQNRGDDTWAPEGENAIATTEEDDASEETSEDERSNEGADAAVAGGSEEDEEEQKGGVDTAVAVKRLDISGLSVSAAEDMERSQTLIDTLQQSILCLKQCGAIGACMNLENEIRKERKRQRSMCQMDTAVAAALVRRRDWEDLQERKRQRLEDDAKRKMLKSRADAVAESEKANALLQKRKKDIAQMEVLLETKQCMKRFTPESLGQGHPKGGCASARKLRLEVLDRMSRTGLGLSPAQKKRLAMV